MKAQDVVKGQTIIGHGEIVSVLHGYTSMFFILKGGKQLQMPKNESVRTLPARDAKGRFVARVVVVISYCVELGDIVTTHLGVKAARRAVSLHKVFFPAGSSVVC